MTKYLFLFILLGSSTLATLKAEETDLNSFEAELRMLESKENKSFEAAEQMTMKELKKSDDFVSDTVSTANAGVKKEEIPSENTEIVIRPAAVKTRRVRSR